MAKRKAKRTMDELVKEALFQNFINGTGRMLMHLPHGEFRYVTYGEWQLMIMQ